MAQSAISPTIPLLDLRKFRDPFVTAKGELVASVATRGAAGCTIVNADDPSTPELLKRTNGPVLRFGRADGADVCAVDVRLGEDLRPHFTLVSPYGSGLVSVGARGLHQVANALAAAAAALLVGCSVAEVVDGLADPSLSPARMEVVRTAQGVTVINDAYNANPASMRAGLASLAELSVTKRYAVLGVMAELGPQSELWHRRIAEEAHASDIAVIAVNAPDYGDKAVHVPSQDGAIELLAASGAFDEGRAILVKGSLVAGLQAMAERLIRQLGGPEVRS